MVHRVLPGLEPGIQEARRGDEIGGITAFP
jgi:hypothetical protein